MAEPRSAVPPALGSGPGDQAPVAHGTRSRGDLSSAGAEAEAGAVQQPSHQRQRQLLTDSYNNKHARHAAAACPRPPQSVPSANATRPAHISRHQSLRTWSYGPARAPARSRCQLSTTAAASEHSSRGGKLGKELPEAAAPRAGSSSRPGRREAGRSAPQTSRQL